MTPNFLPLAHPFHQELRLALVKIAERDETIADLEGRVLGLEVRAGSFNYCDGTRDRYQIVHR